MGSHIASATAAADRLTTRDMPRFLKQIREAGFSGVINFALTTQNSDNPGLLNRYTQHPSPPQLQHNEEVEGFEFLATTVFDGIPLVSR